MKKFKFQIAQEINVPNQLYAPNDWCNIESVKQSLY